MSMNSRQRVINSRSMGMVNLASGLAQSMRRRLDRWMSAGSVSSQAMMEPLEGRIQLSTLVPGEFLVNTTTAGAQRAPSVAGLSSGGYVAVWQSANQDGSGDAVVGQLFSSGNAKSGSEFIINTSTANNQNAPIVTRLSSARFVVVWQSDAQDGNSLGVYGQVYNNDGSKVGGEFLVNQTTSGSQDTPTVAALATGGFVVAWESSDGASDGVYARRFDSSGSASAGEFLVNTTTSQDQGGPSVAGLTDGTFVVTWHSYKQDSGSSYGVYAQRFSSTGAAAGSEFRVNTYSNSHQQEPSVAALSNGGFVVAWESSGADGSSNGVFTQRYTSAGVKAGSETQVNIGTNANQQSPSVAADAGGFYVFWEFQTSSSGDYGIFGRRWNNDGTGASDELYYNAYKSNDQLEPMGAVLTSNKVVLVWESDGKDGSSWSIAGVANDAANELPTTTGIANQNLYGAGSGSVTLTSYFADAELGAAGLTYTIISNTNPTLLTGLAIDAGKLSYNITPDISGEGIITIRATDSVGLYVESSFTVTAVQTLNLTGSVTLSQFDGSGSFNLFTVLGIPAQAQPYVTFTGIKSYTGSDVLSSSGVSSNSLNLTLNGASGSGTFVISGTAAGNSLNASVALTVTDNTAPTVTSVDAGTSPTTSTVGSIEITFSEAIDMASFDWTSVTLTRDGGENLINASTPLSIELVSGTTYRITGLGNLAEPVGKYVLTFVDATVTDIAGNALNGSGEVTWVRAPAAPSAPVLSPADVDVPGSQTTDNKTPTVVGTGTPGATIKIYEGATLLGTGTVDGSGNYSVALSTLADGTHTLVAKASAIINSVTYTADSAGSDILVSSVSLTGITQYPAPRTTPATKLIVTTSNAIDLATFTEADITLTRNGLSISTATVTITEAGAPYSGFSYAINMPPELTSLAGIYVLTVNGATIISSQGTTLTNSAGSYWVNEARFTGLTQFTAQKTGPVVKLGLTASNVLDSGTATAADITLTRNGVPVSTAGITFTAAGAGYAPNTFWINLPDALTSETGNYVLTVNGAGIKSSGVSFANNFSTSWQNAAVLSQLTQYTAPRTTPATMMIVKASAPLDLASFTAADIGLTYNGTPVDTTGITITLAGAGYSVNSYAINIPAAMTVKAGDYVLTLNNAGITSNTVPVNNTLSSSWRTETKLTGITQFPDMRTTPVSRVLVTATNVLDLANFTGADLVLKRDGVTVDTTGVTVVVAGAPYAANTYQVNLPLTATSPAGTYTLEIAGATLTSTGEVVLDDVSTTWVTQARFTQITSFAAPRTTPVNTVVIGMTDALNLATFTAADITLTRDGIPVDTSTITVALAGAAYSANSYTLTIPSALTSATGTYQLSVAGIGIVSAGVPVGNNVSTSWVTEARLTGITQYASPRSIPVTTFIVTSTHALDLATFTLEDISLTQNGDAIDLTGATIALAGAAYSGNSYKITLPSSLTATNGTYVFTVTGAGINSVTNNAVTTDISSTWTTVLPEVVSMSSYPDPRTVPVTAPGIRFTVPINLTTFTYLDLRLTRNGGATNLITSAVTIATTADPNVYTIVIPSTITSIAGTYSLTVTGSGIQSTAGPVVINNGVTTWTQL